MIETYFHKEEGYNPFLVRDGWQVAQLNYLPGHGFNEIEQIEVHRQTDEVFILFKGEAVLIEAKLQKDAIKFCCERMKPGITYNIPAGTWHNVAMDSEVEIIIVEKSDTHKKDCAYWKLNGSEREDLYAMIRRKFL